MAGWHALTDALSLAYPTSALLTYPPMPTSQELQSSMSQLHLYARLRKGASFSAREPMVPPPAQPTRPQLLKSRTHPVHQG